MSYCIVGLHSPKSSINVGHVLRAADAYGASAVCIQRSRVRSPTDTSAAYRKLPVFRTQGSLRELVPFDCIPVAVELVPGAENLVDFKHPDRAFYVFGAEDNTLGEATLSWCKHVIYVPTQICMNLSACVNVVLYDRLAKGHRNNVQPVQDLLPR
jgi:tRNA(Leu) C34 or U34 (ribose-2'-O)-methylase TrmL